MKKLNKLFAILIAVLGVTTLKAQTDVTSTHLTNAGFDDESGWKTSNVGVTSGGNMQDIPGWTKKAVGWSSAATFGYGGGGKVNGSSVPSTGPDGTSNGGAFGFSGSWDADIVYTQAVTLPAGVYTLSYKVFNAQTSTDGNNKLKTNKFGFVASSGTTFYGTTTTFTKSEWTEANTSFVLTTETSGNISIGAAFPGASSSVTPRLIVDGVTLTYKSFDDVSAENPADFTSLIKNPSFETGNLDGWTYKSSSDTGVKPNSNGTYTTSGVDGNYLFNTWWQGTPLTQTVGNIPNGIYELKVLLASDQNAKLFLLANDEHSEVYTITTDNKTFHDVSYEFKVLNGQATIGVIGGNDAGEYVNGGHWWYKADNFRLIYKGADLSIEREALDAALAKARAIDQATIPTVVAVSLNSAISTAENVENALNPIKAATNALLAVLATVDVVQAPYIETKALITSSNNMLTNSTASDADKATFQGVINKAEENLNDATDKATIDAIAVTITNAQKAYCLVASPTEGHPFDMTHLVVNPKFDEGTTGWTHNTGAPHWGIATNQGGEITGNYFENWKWESYTGEIYQELTDLPKGKYKLTAAAFRDQLIDGASDGDAVYVFANDVETLVNSATPVFYSVEVSTTTGSLRFGVKSNVAKYRWMGIDNVSLQFIEALDLSEFIAAYNIALEAAKAARDNAEYSNITGVEKTALLNAIANVPAETQESLSEATAALQSITAAFIAAKGDYDILDSEITVARNLGMTDDAINTVTAGKTGAAAYPDLKVAEYTYICDTYTEEAPIGEWKSNFDNIDGQSYDGSDFKYFDKWGSGTFALKQSVTLPKGDYAISVIARGQNGASGTLYYKVGDATTSTPLIMKNDTGLGVDINGVANFSAEGTYCNDNNGRGWEYRFITFHLDAETEVEFGVTATVNWQWASTYAPKLLTDPSSKKALLLSEIAHLLSNVPSGVMNAEVQNTLNTTKVAAQNASNANTTAELDVIYTEFKDAVDAANASITAYANLARYIGMTEVFTNVSAYQQKYNSRLYTTDEAETVRQELNVMRYNAATAIFTNEMPVTGWTGDLANGVRSDQHWSGATSNYYDANSWTPNFEGLTHSLSAELTLPAGTYVLQAAGRSSDDVTLSLNIKDGETVLESVQYTGKGDTGYGIDTDGKPNFSEEGVYANDDKGRGWEWEFAKFELTKETTVTLYVLCDYNSIQNRFGSFSDIALWMDDATYVTVHGKDLQAPLNAAKALVDTKPMGADENNALKAAIAQAEGKISTPAELDEAINALNTAIDNANAWGPKYNEAKAPLVTALERFEADYNLEGTPDHAHMSNSAWANVLENVKAAALAKDVTDSYEGFATAAENLNAALDAAQASINMYASLAAEISYANAYAPVVAENRTAHTAAIAAAQAAYDAAEINDANELVLAMQNYRALDYAYVMENYNKTVEIGEWKGQTGTNKGEHWSGNAETTYFDYSQWSGTGVYEAKDTVALPAGEYVLMAAGRASPVAGTEAYIKVNDTKVNFATKDAYGRGIATDGTATFATDATYGRNNEGYGWEYRFITFALEAETEVILVAGMNIADSRNPLSWASICTPVLLTPNLTEAQNQLQSAINSAIETRDNAYPVGDEVFQVSENSVAYKTLNEAITTAEDVLVKASTIKALTDEIHTLNAEVDNYLNGYVLNAPAESQRFYIKVATEGHGKYGNAVLATLGNTVDNNPTGYGLNANNAVKPHLNQAFIFKQVEGNLYNISIERAEGTVYLTYGSLNGSAAGWNQWQIQATTDEANKGTFKIEATAKESILKIQNTITNEYLDCQDGGSIYTDTNIKNEEFAFELATESEVTLTLSKVGWATLILPFDAELPEGVQAWSCGEVDGEDLKLDEATSIKANTPYLMNGNAGEYPFTGYGMADKDRYTDGLFTGTYIEYQTTANSNTYVLQKKGNDVAFYLVGESGQPTVGANRIYMTYADAAGAPRFSFGRGGNTTSIDNSQFTIDNEVVIYDIMGRKVNTMEKGKMYIVNGKKVVIR